MAAIDAGQVSVEDLLLGGAFRSMRFRNWLGHRLQRVPHHYKGEPVLRRASLSPVAIKRAVESAREQFVGRPGIIHVTWGAKISRGSALPQDGLVFIVDQKRDVPEGSSDHIPNPFTVETPEGPVQVPTDVRVLARGVRHAGLVNPGFQCSVTAGSNRGSLGCITANGAGFVAVISGHVGVTKGVPVSATAASGAVVSLGVVQAVRNDQDVDAARVGPVPQENLGGLTDGSTRTRDLDVGDVHLSIEIAVTHDSGKVFAHVESVSEPASFPDSSGGNTQMNGLIRLDQAVTIHGDSGAPALDATGLLVGFVVGVADSRTYLIPAGRAIQGVS